MYFHSVRTMQLDGCKNTNKKRVLSMGLYYVHARLGFLS